MLKPVMRVSLFIPGNIGSPLMKTRHTGKEVRAVKARTADFEPAIRRTQPIPKFLAHDTEFSGERSKSGSFTGQRATAQSCTFRNGLKPRPERRALRKSGFL